MSIGLVGRITEGLLLSHQVLVRSIAAAYFS
jgi:hypothetical protein